MRKSFVGAGLAGAIVAALLGTAACGSAQPAKPAPASGSPPKASSPAPVKKTAAAQKVTFLLDFIPSGYQAPFYLGVAKGYYRAAGLNVRIIPGRGSGAAVQEIGHDTYDIGLADATVAAAAISKHVPIKVVASYFQKNPFGLLFKTSSHITKPSSLIGKAIAENPAGAAPKLLDAFLSINHIKRGQINLVNMSGQSLVPSVLAGRTAASVGIVALSVPQARARGYHVSGMVFSDWGLGNLSTSLIVNNAYLKAHAGVVKSFIAASDRAWQAAIGDPAAAVAAQRKALGAGKLPPGSVQTLKDVIPLLHTANSKGHPLGWMSPKDWTTTLDVLHQYYNAKVLPTATYYTDAYIPS